MTNCYIAATCMLLLRTRNTRKLVFLATQTSDDQPLFKTERSGPKHCEQFCLVFHMLLENHTTTGQKS